MENKKKMEKEASNLEDFRKAGPVFGTYIGCMWIVSFICMANTMAFPVLSILGMGIGIGSLAAIVILIYQFRWRNCHGQLSFLQSWVLVIQTILYASILMAFGIYIYMRFFDHGNFGAYYDQMLKDPATKALMDQFLASSGITSEEFVAQFTAITPIKLAVNIMESNFIMGFFLSLPLTLFTRIKLGLSIEKKA